MSALKSMKSKSSDRNKPAIPIIQEIPLSAIEIRAGRRVLDMSWVETLAQYIATNGQQVPIEVVTTKSGFRLITGSHRVAACGHNFAQTILAIVKQPEDFASEADIRLHEIVENFMRRELNVLDRAT